MYRCASWAASRVCVREWGTNRNCFSLENEMGIRIRIYEAADVFKAIDVLM